MTKVEMKTVKCSKCGEKSQQMVVHTVNYSLGDKESNDKLREHLQKCPNCGYEAPQIGFYIKEESVNNNSTNEDLYNINVEDNRPQFVYGVPDFINFDKEEDNDKYDIKPEQNVPQRVYGVPNFEKECKPIKVFEAFVGGYFGPSEYYYIFKMNDYYTAKYYKSTDGHLVNEDSPELIKINKFAFEYNMFITEIKEIITKWDDHYTNPNVLDGTQWSINLIVDNIKKGGSNAYPKDYKETFKIINEFFSEESDDYDINPSDNNPQKAYGTPNTINKKYDINPKDNYPREVYGIPKPPKWATCPECGSTNIKKYLYGLPASNYNSKIYVLGGCEIIPGAPTHKCMDCNTDLYLKKSIFGNKFIKKQ